MRALGLLVPFIPFAMLAAFIACAAPAIPNAPPPLPPVGTPTCPRICSTPGYENAPICLKCEGEEGSR